MLSIALYSGSVVDKHFVSNLEKWVLNFTFNVGLFYMNLTFLKMVKIFIKNE